MPQIKENFFENILFTFESYSCNCVIDIEHTVPGEKPLKKYKLQTDLENKLVFGYAAKKGLVRIAANGTIEELNILGSLMSLTTTSCNDKILIQFFKENGFILPLCENAYETIDEKSLFQIINRLKYTVELMTAISEIKKDYSKICNLILSLLFSEDITMQTKNMENPYRSCHHSFIDFINSPITTLSFHRQTEGFKKNSYTITNTLYDNYELEVSEYNDIIGGYSKISDFNDPLFKNLTYSLVNYEPLNMNRKISHLLFHIFHDYGMKNISTNIFYYSTADFENITDIMKLSMIDVAKHIISSEINANLNGIYPLYNIENMTPSWKVDTLLCASYFSVFYLKPDLELYRPCDNPRCQKYFLVKTTSTKTRYCSTECCNRVTQDRYRKRKREQNAK